MQGTMGRQISGWSAALLVSAVLLMGVAAAGCSRYGAADPIGYSGPYPKGDAQQTVRQDLCNLKYVDDTNAFGGGEWMVSGFAVVPNDRSPKGKGPIILLVQHNKQEFVPVENDADVADFYHRVTGKVHPTLPTAPLSDPYKKTLKLP